MKEELVRMLDKFSEDDMYLLYGTALEMLRR